MNKLDKNIIVSAHGNSIRSLCKYLFNLDNKKISSLEIPTGNPLLIETEKDIENVYVQLFSYNYINCTNDRKICPICGGSSVMIIENEVSIISLEVTPK